MNGRNKGEFLLLSLRPRCAPSDSGHPASLGIYIRVGLPLGNEGFPITESLYQARLAMCMHRKRTWTQIAIMQGGEERKLNLDIPSWS